MSSHMCQLRLLFVPAGLYMEAGDRRGHPVQLRRPGTSWIFQAGVICMAQQHTVQPRDLPLQPDHRYEHVEAPAGIKGGFRFSLTDGAWWWSPGMYALHGYRQAQMRSVAPSTRLILSHRHPADRQAMAAAWAHL